MHRLSVLFLPFLLAACSALPPPLALVTQAADGVSYVLTGKTGTDHVFSEAMKEDCALARALVGLAVCRAKPENSSFAQAQSREEGGHPGAALDRPVGDDETVGLDPVLLPREMAGLAPVTILDGGGAARSTHAPEIGPAAFADPKRRVSAPVISKLVLRPATAKPIVAPASEPEKAPPVAAVKTKASPAEASQTKGPQIKQGQTKPGQLKGVRTPRADGSYYVVVGTYRNWVTALENAGRQSQGLASVVTAGESGGKTHRVLIGPFDHRGASDTRRLVGNEGYRSAWLVRSCASGPAARDSAVGAAAGACMDLAKTWR